MWLLRILKVSSEGYLNLMVIFLEKFENLEQLFFDTRMS